MSEVPVVEVTAVGRATCVPDQVHVRLAVEVLTLSVDASLRGAAAAVEQLLAVLEQAGVGPADRRTSGLSVEQHWVEDRSLPRPHAATYRLDVVVRDLDAAGLLVQRAGEQVGDALRVHGFDLGVADSSQQQEQARREAVAVCRARAQTLAEAAGAHLGPLVRLREGTGDHQLVLHESAASGRGGRMAVEGGTLEVAVAVTGVWQLEAAAAV